MAFSAEKFEAAIYEEIAQRSANQERTFFHRFVDGQLSRDALKEYYRHLYHECTHFVRLVSAVHANAEKKDQRLALAHNLLEEYGHGEPGMDHPNLAMNIGKALGLTEGEIEDHGLYPEVIQAFAKLKEVALSSYLEGLAVLVTIEADLPLRHTLMREALIQHYGLAAGDLTYYDEHRTGGTSKIQADGGYGGDDVHVAREVGLLARYARTDEDQKAVLRSITLAFEARGVLVRAMEQHCVPR